MDQLFPERTRHKNLSSPTDTPLHVPVTTPAVNQNSSTNNSVPEVEFRDTNTNNDEHEVNEEEPIAPNRPHIHSKTKNWYSGFCNRYASLLGAFVKILIMLLVNWLYALGCIAVLFFIWLYVGTTNPAGTKPGITHEFKFFVWLKTGIFRCFG